MRFLPCVLGLTLLCPTSSLVTMPDAICLPPTNICVGTTTTTTTTIATTPPQTAGPSSTSAPASTAKPPDLSTSPPTQTSHGGGSGSASTGAPSSSTSEPVVVPDTLPGGWVLLGLMVVTAVLVVVDAIVRYRKRKRAREVDHG